MVIDVYCYKFLGSIVFGDGDVDGGGDGDKGNYHTFE